MVRYAADLLVEPAFEYGLTNFILRQISVLDDLGAWEWNLRWASLLWVAIFAGIRIFLGERGGVIWYALIHAILTGVGGTVCAYLSFVSAEHMTGTPGEKIIDVYPQEKYCLFIDDSYSLPRHLS